MRREYDVKKGLDPDLIFWAPLNAESRLKDVISNTTVINVVDPLGHTSFSYTVDNDSYNFRRVDTSNDERDCIKINTPLVTGNWTMLFQLKPIEYTHRNRSFICFTHEWGNLNDLIYQFPRSETRFYNRIYTGSWFNIARTSNKLYVNGVQVGSLSNVSFQNIYIKFQYMKSDSLSNRIEGNWKQLSIFNRILTLDEINSWFQHPGYID